MYVKPVIHSQLDMLDFVGNCPSYIPRNDFKGACLKAGNLIDKALKIKEVTNEDCGSVAIELDDSPESYAIFSYIYEWCTNNGNYMIHRGEIAKADNPGSGLLILVVQ